MRGPFPSLRLQLPRYVKTPALICLLVSSIITLLVLVNFFTLQPVVPLFYSLAQPQDYLTPKIWLTVFPLTSFLITFIHLALLKSIQNYEKIIQQLYVWLTVVIQLLLLLALIRILTIIS